MLEDNPFSLFSLFQRCLVVTFPLLWTQTKPLPLDISCWKFAAASFFSENDGRLVQSALALKPVPAHFWLLELPGLISARLRVFSHFVRKSSKPAALPSLQTCSFFLVQWTGKWKEAYLKTYIFKQNCWGSEWVYYVWGFIKCFDFSGCRCLTRGAVKLYSKHFFFSPSSKHATVSRRKR